MNWDSVNWDSVNWDSVNWDSVNWNSDYWGDGGDPTAVRLSDLRAVSFAEDGGWRATLTPCWPVSEYDNHRPDRFVSAWAGGHIMFLSVPSYFNISQLKTNRTLT